MQILIIRHDKNEIWFRDIDGAVDSMLGGAYNGNRTRGSEQQRLTGRHLEISEN